MSLENIKLPDLGEGVTEGEMVKWLVNVGDTVHADQPIAEVMTDKATVEVPTPISGVVKELKASEGDIIPVETTLLLLESDGSRATSNTASSSQEKSPSASVNHNGSSPIHTTEMSSVASFSATTQVQPPVAHREVLATPSTRRLAREMTVDINQIRGSGPVGRVTREDVLTAKSGGSSATSSKATHAPIPQRAFVSQNTQQEERVPMRGIRRKVAEAMQMSKQIVPHFTLMDEANVTQLVKFRAEAKAAAQKHGINVTYLPFMMKALIATMREYPMFNASIDDQASEVVYKKYFNIGFAADTPNGLVVPVIHHADQKTILQISQEIMDLATRAREGKLKSEEMKGATITITNIGSVGGNYATPIINHPEVAILGMYKIVDKPVMINGKFRAAKVMNLTITADHRLIDGAVAANFLTQLIGRLEKPSQLMLDMI